MSFRRLLEGLVVVIFAAFAAPWGGSAKAAPMAFELVPVGNPAQCHGACPEMISAVGEITSATPAEFYDFVASNIGNPRMRSIVLLHSPGGSVAASMRLGEMFRRTGVAAVVARALSGQTEAGQPVNVFLEGRCFSACVYAFMGGKKRVVPPQSFIGIHRMFYDERERDMSSMSVTTRQVYGTPDFVAQLARYAGSMGISRDLIYTAERISPDHIHILNKAELKRWRLASTKF